MKVGAAEHKDANMRLWAGVTAGLLTMALVSWGLSLTGCGRPAEQPAEKPLMTEEEAAEARVPDEEWVVTERFRGAGPEIVILEPVIEETAKGLTAEVGKPFDLRVQFLEAAQPVDMASLRVRAKVGFLPKVSLTERLQPYIKETVLDGRALTVPKGKYLIEISIADTGGALSTETIRVRVRG